MFDLELPQGPTIWQDLKGRVHLPVVVSYYTDRFYQREAYELARSCHAHALDYRIEHVPDLGSWEANTNHKPTFLRAQSVRFEHRALLWLDADARVRAQPDMLVRLQTPLAYHLWRGKRVASGTVYLGALTIRDLLLATWEDEVRKDPTATDQVCLGRAAKLCLIGPTLLPYPYLAISDLGVDGKARALDPSRSVVIEHTQASRFTKALEAIRKGKVRGGQV